MGSYAYQLGYLRRGQFGTVSAAHAAGSAFVRLDDAVFRYPYAAAQVGKTLHLKFRSFNQYQQQVQDLATCVDYTFTLGSAPPDITNFTVAAGQGGNATFMWDPITSLAVLSGGFVVVRYSSATSGVTWDTATEVARAPGNAVTLPITGYMSGTYLCKALDNAGQYSKNATALNGTASGGGGGALSVTLSATSLSRAAATTSSSVGPVTATPSGGTGPFTYTWSRVSGSARIAISSATAQAPSFSIADLAGAGDQAQAVWQCVVTDSTPGTRQTATSSQLTVTFTGRNPPSGGGAQP